MGDSSLTTITALPNSITTIGAKTFKDCSLTSITIPESITFVGHQAFDSCPLESIVWLSTAPMYQKVNDVSSSSAFQSIDSTNLKFVYSNSSYFDIVIYSASDCKVILTESLRYITGTLSTDLSASINYTGSQEELNNVIMPGTTIGEFKTKYPTSTIYDYNVNYTLTADDLAIINAA